MTTDVAQREYLEYLKSCVIRVARSKNGPTWDDLMGILHDTNFEWSVPNDDNRIADGRDIRFDWMEENGVEAIGTSASFLEVLIGLSRHLAFLTDESAEGWAWQLLINLGLDDKSDRLFSKGEREVEEILDTCIHRNYAPNGRGGFFPLTMPDRDQREVEIWYQLNAYVEELLP